MARRRAAAGVALVLAAIAIGLAGAWLTRPAPSEREAARLIELAATGLAHLERGELAESDRAFSEVARDLPDAALGWRNLVVTRLLALESAPQSERAAIEAKLDAALEGLRPIEGPSVTFAMLEARRALLAGDERAAVDHLERAARLAPEDAGVWYALHLATRDAADRSLAKRSRDALRRAFELRPDNLFVMLDWLLAQAREHDAAIADTLPIARRAVAPFAEGLRLRTQVDLIDALDRAAEAVAGRDWKVADEQIRIFANVLRPEVAVQLDLQRLVHHDLDFALDRFDEKVLRRASDASPAPAIPVSFVMPAEQPPPLEDVRGAVLADVDLDGAPDLVVARGDRVEAYGHREGRWTLLAGLDLGMPVHGVIASDLDRDTEEAHAASPPSDPQKCETADADLVAFGPRGVALLENRIDEHGVRSLRVREPQGALAALRDVLAAAFADLDHDGDLDLVVSARSGLSLWINRGDFRFEDISARSDLPPPALQATTLVPVDWNRNVDIDVVLAGRGGTPAGYLENVRHGRFRWHAFDETFDALREAHALALGDFDGNASWDLLAATGSGLRLTLTRTPSPGSVRALSTTALTGSTVERARVWDYDNDGRADILAWGSSGLSVRRGLGAGAFEPIEDLVAADVGAMRDAAVADIDRDGDPDLLLVGSDRVVWLSNEGGNRNHWLDVELSGQRTADRKDERVNVHGIGSLIEVKAGASYQAQVASSPRTHFGLGDRERADIARVLWTNGIPQNTIRPASDSPICEVQILKGSCPYLYTWTGSSFEFETDLLWASPIGLQLAENVLARPRQWEYLKVPGERLAPRDGAYELRITEELWEAAYFDRVELIAVDHPRAVEVYSNEKVGPAELAPFRIHTVANPRTPVAARDQRGRDVLAVIAARDGRYLKSFDRRKVQGLVDDHYLELDLGQLERPEHVTLFLTGWIHPTDTSLNVAISQDPSLAAPRPPSLWVPDDEGVWREVMPYMGFPGGKTKTIAVDLSNAFASRDYRVRIATNMEIYWDAAFFTVDEAPVDVRSSRLRLLGADLRHRGYSRRVDRPGNGPESYDYDTVSDAPAWPPMHGRFTRYGDVTALLGETDDRLVVMGAGDEVTLRFELPAQPLPPGWKRDFILHNVGWDKDADLNTVYGQAVEPLPFNGMDGYPDARRMPAADTSAHQAYLGDYETRTQRSADFWHWVRDYRAD